MCFSNHRCIPVIPKTVNVNKSTVSCIVGIDYGRRRIGLAISDSAKKMALPFDVIVRKGSSYGFTRLQKLLEGRSIDYFVVGVPYRNDGTLGDTGREALDFSKSLEDFFNIKVLVFDESYTTFSAENSLRPHYNGRKIKRFIDAVAAQIMLQSFLDDLNSP